MRPVALLTGIIITAILAAPMVSLADVITYVPYQGDLRDPEGNPVPDASYTIDFSIWDDQTVGEQLWSETQIIETSNGKFTLYLGEIQSLSPDVFTATDENIERYLQIQVAGDQPMSPRILMGDAPSAFISARVRGDIVTEQNKLSVGEENDALVVIARPAPFEGSISIGIGELQEPVVDFLADASGGSASFKGISTLSPEIKLVADDLGASLNLILNEDARTSHSASEWGAWSDLAMFRLADPRPSPDFIIKTDAGGSKIEIGDIEGTRLIENLDLSLGANQSETWFSMYGTNDLPVVDFLANANGAKASLKGISTLNPEIKLIADDAGASLNLLLNEDARTVYSASEWGAWSDLAMFRLADPRPSPDFIITTDGTGSKIEMGDIEGSRLIENVVLSIVGDDTGGNISLLGGSPLAPSVHVIANQTGANIDLTCDSEEQPKVEIATDCSGANIAFGFAVDFPAKPGIDIGINTVSANLSLLIGSEQQPVVDFLADASGGSLGLFEYNSLAKMEMHPGGVSLYDPEGNKAFGVEEVSLTMYDVSSAAKTEMHAGGVNVYTTDGELAAVFEPNGVVAPKGNFGYSNTNAGTNTLVVGLSNSAAGNYSSVLGGSGNIAGGGSAVVCGGSVNSASFGGAFVGGGQNNTASGLNAVIGGGNGNNATGNNSTVPGGASNVASGNYSLAGGLRARAVHQGAFVWADATGASFSSDLVNQYKVRASGGTYIYSNSEASVGVRLSSGSSQWQSISDRNAKRNIRPVDGEEILQQLQQLPVSRWSYKDQDEDIEHIGPMAQDFYALFSIGEDDRHISMLDPSGVALAGVKELISRIEELEARIAELETERQ